MFGRKKKQSEPECVTPTVQKVEYTYDELNRFVNNRVRDQMAEFRKEFKATTFRTKQLRFIGGSWDGVSEWIDKADPEVVRWARRTAANDGYFYHGSYASREETYRLIGTSQKDRNVSLYEFVGFTSDLSAIPLGGS